MLHGLYTLQHLLHSPIHTLWAEAAVQGANLLILSNLGFSLYLLNDILMCSP